jgi:hypothetical protein
MIWLTLIAFGVQLAVAVLHHHNYEFNGQSLAAAANACPSKTQQPCSPLQHDRDHDGCVLCWATAMAAASLAPLVPELPKPQQLFGVRLAVRQNLPSHVIHREYFQARGPPSFILS